MAASRSKRISDGLQPKDKAHSHGDEGKAENDESVDGGGRRNAEDYWTQTATGHVRLPDASGYRTPAGWKMKGYRT